MPYRWTAMATMAMALLAMAPPARAQAGPTPIVQAKLVAERPAIVPGRPLSVALVLKAPAGWHTYWRNPGAAGAATTLDWRLPNGFASGPLRWPAPSRFVTGPLVSYGFSGETWLFDTLTTPADLDVGKTISLAATAEWLACADICVPEQARVSLSLPVVAPSALPETDSAFVRAQERLPRPLSGRASFSVTDGQAMLVLPGIDTADAARAWFFPIEDGVIDDAGPQRATLENGRLLLRVPLAPPNGTAPARLTGVVVVGERAFDIEATPRP